MELIMKTFKFKNAFTLAEILITLGIIGVVAALTAPSLVQNAGNAKIGPTLQKTVSTLENANRQLMVEKEASSLSGALDTDIKDFSNNTAAAEKYAEAVSNYIQGSSYELVSKVHVDKYNEKVNGDYTNQWVLHIGNVDVRINSEVKNTATVSNATRIVVDKGSFIGPYYNCLAIDINGYKNSPNAKGKDIFYFVLDDSGKIFPVGGKTHMYYVNQTKEFYQTDGSRCNETAVDSGGSYCAGSIFDNNLKVIYK